MLKKLIDELDAAVTDLNDKKTAADAAAEASAAANAALGSAQQRVDALKSQIQHELSGIGVLTRVRGGS